MSPFDVSYNFLKTLHENDIYISTNNATIKKYSFGNEFKILEEFCSHGFGEKQFDKLHGICYNNGYLYICDMKNTNFKPGFEVFWHN